MLALVQHTHFQKWTGGVTKVMVAFSYARKSQLLIPLYNEIAGIPMLQKAT